VEGEHSWISSVDAPGRKNRQRGRGGREGRGGGKTRKRQRAKRISYRPKGE